MVTLFNTIHETQQHTERTVVVNRTPHKISGGYSLAQFEYKLLQEDGLKSLSLRVPPITADQSINGESVELYFCSAIGRSGVIIKHIFRFFLTHFPDIL